MNPYALLPLTNCVICILLTSYIFHLNQKNPLNRAFLGLGLVMTYWAFSVFGLRSAETHESARFWMEFSSLWPFVPATLFYFVLVFIGWHKIAQRKDALYAIFGPAVAFCLIEAMTNTISADVSRQYWGYRIDGDLDSILYWVSHLWGFALGFAGLVLCVRCTYIAPRGIHRRAARLVTLALAAPIAISLVTELILPALDIVFPELSTASFCWLATLVAVAIRRYDLFGITVSSSLDQFLSAIIDPLLILNRRWRIASFNQAFLDYTGYSDSQLQYRAFEEILDQEGPTAAALLEITVQGASSGELHLTHADGHNLQTAVSASSLMDNRGAALGTMCVFRDMSQQKSAEENLALNNKLVALRADIWEVASKKTHDEDDLIQSLLEKIGPAINVDKACYYKLAEEKSRDKDLTCSLEWRRGELPSSLGTIIPYNVLEYLLVDPDAHNQSIEFDQLMLVPFFVDEQMQGVLAFADEVGACGVIVQSEVNQLIIKEFLKIVSNHIARRKADDALRDSEDQLRQSQKMHAIGQLAGGIAHDFNNLLGGISGFSDVLKLRLDKASPEYGFVTRISQAANRAADLSRQLLAFARRSRVSMQPMDVNDAIEKTVDVLRHTLDKNIEIQAPCNGPHRRIVGDSSLIENALLNLAINARDAMPNGGTLSIGAGQETLEEYPFPGETFPITPGEYYKISIKDTGSGIDPVNLSHIFEPFFTTKEVGKGTGLGLASVFGTIKQHKGYIIVDSQVGQGTEFNIYLPVPDLSEHTGVSDEEASIILGRGRVLLVDDEAAVRDSTAEMLTAVGYDVLSCDNSDNAVELYTRHNQKVDLVILDLMLPRISGIDCFRKLQTLNPDVRAIFTSGNADADKRAQVTQEGGQALLDKPFKIGELSQAVAQALRKERQ